LPNEPSKSGRRQFFPKDDLLKEEGISEETRHTAMKRVIARQIGERAARYAATRCQHSRAAACDRTRTRLKKKNAAFCVLFGHRGVPLSEVEFYLLLLKCVKTR
jgi:hypothetical protein